MRCSSTTPKLASQRAGADAHRTRTAASRSGRPCAACPIHSAETLYRPADRQRATRWPSASRWRTRPPPKGLVKREVIRMITPGTVLESTMLDEKRQQLSSASVYLRQRGARRLLCGHFHRRDVCDHDLLGRDGLPALCRASWPALRPARRCCPTAATDEKRGRRFSAQSAAVAASGAGG